ncbi:MAG: hypothetical protein ACM3NR_00325 [Methanosarcina sp.]
MKIFFKFIAVSFLLLEGCTHYYYVSNTQQVPLFTEKDELSCSGGMLIKYRTNSVELQGAYTLTDKIAVSAAFLHVDAKEDFNWGKGNYFEAAAGYYKPVKNHRSFEIYGGIGGSKQKHGYQAEYLINDTLPRGEAGGISDMKFVKFFVQPSYGWKYKGFELALSARFNNLTFFDIDNKIIKNQLQFQYLREIENRNNFFFFEPALTIRFGTEHLKVQVQGLVDSYLNNGRNGLEECHVSVGLSCRFGDLGRKIQ